MSRPLDMKLVTLKFGKLKKVKLGNCVFCGHKANGGKVLCAKHSTEYRLWRSNHELNTARKAIAKVVGASPFTHQGKLAKAVKPTRTMLADLQRMAKASTHKHVVRFAEHVASLVAQAVGAKRVIKVANTIPVVEVANVEVLVG